MNRALSWLKQAHSDFKWAKLTFDGGFYAQTCFVCQQVAEKALKAIAYSQGAKSIKGHGVAETAKLLNINGQLEAAAKELDLFYISSRYPDALPNSIAPVDFFSQAQGQKALDYAKLFLEKADVQVSNG
jgi:HEPN domain-containing protein